MKDRKRHELRLACTAHKYGFYSLERVAVRNDKALTSHPRAHPPHVAAYSALKKTDTRIPREFGGFVEGKCDFILSVPDRRAQMLGLHS
jgi:hypothetical protein